MSLTCPPHARADVGAHRVSSASAETSRKLGSCRGGPCGRLRQSVIRRTSRRITPVRSFSRSRRYIRHSLLVSLQAFMGAEVKGLRAAHEAVGKFCGNKHAANGVALGLTSAHSGRVSRCPVHGTILPARRRGTEEP